MNEGQFWVFFSLCMKANATYMPVFAINEMNGEEPTAMGSLEEDISQGFTWVCLQTNNNILTAFILI